MRDRLHLAILAVGVAMVLGSVGLTYLDLTETQGELGRFAIVAFSAAVRR